MFYENVLDEDILHVGVGHEDDPPGRGSGRYGWGSGENPGQHQFDFLSEVSKLKARGIKDADIAKMLLGVKRVKKDGTEIWANTSDLRAEIAIQRTAQRQINRARAIKLLDECKGNVSEVARRMGKNESSIRSLLDPIKAERTSRYENTAAMIKKVVDSKGVVDVSNGTEIYLGVTDSTKKVALSILEKEGYVKTWVKVPQLGTTHETSIMVLAPPGTPYSEIHNKRFEISPIQDFTPDQGKTWWTPQYPNSMSSNRIQIRYKEDGGQEKDGVIEINPNAKDLSLDGSRYAQVRIGVDGTHYMKGMAIYGTDMPKGVDVIYNTNKSKDTPKMEVFKKMKTVTLKDGTEVIDKDNPFGASIKRGGQHYYTDENGKEVLSPINKLQEQGDWDTWSRNLSTQFLSKQPIKLIKQQIELSVADKRTELEEIKRLTNPVIRKKLLEEFASGCDANAVDLSVRGIKNQAFQVLLPITDMKDGEIYAPNYANGDRVALVRYPHAGPFEIPILKVNNKQDTASKIIGKTGSDAVGINLKVAERLSGADFDGDTALVIPLDSNKISVKSVDYLPGLKGFDPKEMYKLPDDAPVMKNRTKQNEMGRVTNLIADMTVLGATYPEIERAVRHSMVVIDAEKHHLDYKKSANDNRIDDLKKEYQMKDDGSYGGASTIFSKSKSITRVNKRKEVNDVNKMTPEEVEDWKKGKKIYHETGETIIKRVTDPSKMTPEELKLHEAGKKVYRDTGKPRQEEVHRMEIVDDARELVHDSSNPKEMLYAGYANDLKAMANEARKEARSVERTPVSPEARRVYSEEVESLNTKLRIAESNAPRERQAQTIGNSAASERIQSNPDMDHEHRQRVKAEELNRARAIVGAGKDPVEITDREWEAIQANAISQSKLERILNNTDQDAFKKRATPRVDSYTLSSPQIARIETMIASGMYTQKEIADRFGVSTSTISAIINESK